MDNKNKNNIKLKRDKSLSMKNNKTSPISSMKNNKQSMVNNQLLSKILPPKKPSMTSMVMKSLLYLVFLLVLAGLVFMVYKTIKTYVKRNKIENEGDVLIIDDWVNGMSSEFESDVSMPQLTFGNNYSFSFMLFLNQPSENNQQTEQVIFKKGSDLELIIPPLEQNDNRNILKLIFSLEQPQLIENNDALKRPFVSQSGNNQLNNQEINENGSRQVVVSMTEETTEDITETSQKIIKSSFTNLSNNMINYPTVQHIHPKEKFDLIQNEKFQTTNVLNTDANNDTDGTDDTTNTQLATDNNLEDMLVNDKPEVDTICINKERLINRDYVEIHNIANTKVNHITVSIHDNVVDIYNNGQLESSKLLSNLPVISGTPFTFFEDNGLNGFIKTFRFYNRSLNQDDVEKYYIKDSKKSNNITFF